VPRPLPPPPEPYAVLSGALAPTHARRDATWRLLVWVLAALAMAALALSLVALLVSATGTTAFAIGLVLAAIPAVAVVSAFLWLDRYEPEPPGVLVFAFAWGAVVAALASALVNSVSLEVAAAVSGDADAMTRTAVLVAPVVEESTKGLGVLLVLLAWRREFDGVVDGIVCAGMVGVGFAFSENILYFGRAYLEGGGLASAGAVFLLRGVFSPFAHPLFTIATGIGIGIGVAAGRGAGAARGAWRGLAPVLGLGVAMALHSTWNYTAVAGFEGFVAGYVGVMVPLFAVALCLAVWLRSREGRLIARHLPAYAAAGWMPAYDVSMVATMAGRRRARGWARSYFGAEGERAMVAYQRAATELAFLRDRAGRVAVPDYASREHTLLLDLARQRAVFAHGPAFGG
jgi:RsiW-degrading membrane proteinase PrsW (M82 family)